MTPAVLVVMAKQRNPAMLMVVPILARAVGTSALFNFVLVAARNRDAKNLPRPDPKPRLREQEQDDDRFGHRQLHGVHNRAVIVPLLRGRGFRGGPSCAIVAAPGQTPSLEWGLFDPTWSLPRPGRASGSALTVLCVRLVEPLTKRFFNYHLLPHLREKASEMPRNRDLREFGLFQADRAFESFDVIARAP